MVVRNIEYVPEADTLAIVTLKETQSASLRTTNAILIAAVLVASLILNVLFLIAVMLSKQFRQSHIYLMYCHLTIINTIDLFFNVFLSLIFVTGGTWSLGSTWCTFNVAVQQFVQFYTLLSMALMAGERSLGLIMGADHFINGKRYISGFKLSALSFALCLVSIGIASIVFTSAVPTRPFRNRYICGIGEQSPIAYVIVRAVIYIITLIMLIVSICAILKKRSVASLPLQSHEYTDFIKKNRAMQEHKSRAKLLIFILCVFIVIEGPYIVLCLIYEGASSAEFHEQVITVSQDADTLITWLKFIFPLLCPIMILSWCNDVWMKVKEIMCCRSYDPPTIGQFIPTYNGMAPIPSVMTLVATDEGIQLKMPAGVQNSQYSGFAFPEGPSFEGRDDDTFSIQASAQPVGLQRRNTTQPRQSRLPVQKTPGVQRASLIPRRQPNATPPRTRVVKKTVKRENPPWKK